ncbi:MAG: hypothetical protein HYU02_08005 [Thaumarchaeota archaeon]|nr:hypothetical protein [Nitrososphaerota archaeon]
MHVVYVDWNTTNANNPHADIKYVNSANCNRLNTTCTWSTPIIINRDNTNRDQWESAIHVSNITSSTNPRGTVHVTALDKRDDSTNQKWKAYHYYCKSGAVLSCTTTAEWTNEAVSDVQIDNQGEAQIGDYHGLANTKTKEAYTVWTDSRNLASNKFDIYGDWEYR